MAPERVITCLSMVLVFAALFSFAQSTQDGDILADSNHRTTKTVPAGEGLQNGGDERAVMSATNNKWLRGRKMVQMKKLKDVKMSGGNIGVGVSSPSKLSNCGNNNNSNLRCEQVTVNLSDEADDHRSAGFVAFNADYHAPRHHPPKNN